MRNLALQHYYDYAVSDRGRYVKYRYLDGLRGWAALIVVLDHFVFAFFPAVIVGGYPLHSKFDRLFHNTPLFNFVNGDLSVCIFFVLSAIVLSAKFFRTTEVSVVVASASKRYFRLAIPVIGTVFIAFLGMKLHIYRNANAAQLSSSIWFSTFWQFPAHLRDAVYEAFYGVFITGTNTYNRVLWTMQYEFIGSFLIFLILSLFGQVRRRYIFYIFLIVIFFKTYYLPFLFGLLLSDFMHSGRKDAVFSILERWAWIPIMFFGFILGAFPPGDVSSTLYSPMTTFFSVHGGITADQLRTIFHSFAAFSIVIGVMTSGLLQSFLSNRVSQFLGKISFSMYLLHFIILASFSSYLFIALRYQFGYIVSFMISLATSLVTIIIASDIYARYVDQFAINSSVRIYKNFFERKDSNKTTDRVDPAAAAVVFADISFATDQSV